MTDDPVAITDSTAITDRAVKLRLVARAMFDAGVHAALPGPLVSNALASPSLQHAIRNARRILVLGAGKAGAAMASACETALAPWLDRVVGWVNVPAGSEQLLKAIRLHPARPAGSNHPAAEGVVGALEILRLADSAGPDDLAICLLSGGGSALLPAPASGITLDDKQAVTQLLHRCGATIHEMNAVRKHLSAIKGGGLAARFRGRKLFTLIVSDVIGDPLDVIASGPTAADPSTFADAWNVLQKYQIIEKTPKAVLARLEAGMAGAVPETPKSVPEHVENLVIGSNRLALQAAEDVAKSAGFRVLNLGGFIEGETSAVATAIAGIARSIRETGIPVEPPACILLGGETTVTLGTNPGLGGRNVEFVLAALQKLGKEKGVLILSGGTDGEDGPTDAAGAIADHSTLSRAEQLRLAGDDYLRRHDAYSYFDRTGDLIRTGLTGTNVMDVRAILVT